MRKKNIAVNATFILLLLYHKINNWLLFNAYNFIIVIINHSGSKSYHEKKID